MPEWLMLILTVPVITGVIGWVTNWAAVKMIFHPAAFVGAGPFGWQGILYKQGDKFATGVADMVQDNLITAREIAERIEPEGIEEILSKHVEPEVEGLCRQLADELVKPGAWDELPDHVKTMIQGLVVSQTKTIGKELMVELQGMADEFIDVHATVYKQLSGANVDRLARLTKKIGKSEFKFIEIYGGVFGFIIGTFQVGVWTVMQRWWLMPIVGVLVGLVTNWLAIQMIFRPQEPKKYFGLITYQGLFAKRQPEIAADYGETARTEILTPEVLIRMLTEGENGQKIMAKVNALVTERVTAEWKKYEAMVPFEVTPEHIQKAQGILLMKVMTLLPTVRPELEAYLEEKLDIGNTVETRLASMPKDDFERVLRGIFEEDELTLILVGGFLGGAVGLLQGFIVLSI